ncbi:MAG: trypsin-like peptidase domain-containing protein [Syntrophomonadaceae bacterium]|nr:trypsin-like peptidase domain-containing protein [Syntrophomonadaceae bacterium]
MEKYIVKVRSYFKDECIEYGTGVMIAVNLVLTPRHVACGDRYTVWIDDKEYQAYVIKENDFAVVLEISQSDYAFTVADIFSDDEILDEKSTWSVSGFISSQQCEHHMRGTGIIVSPASNLEWDYHLAATMTGRADNYQGLSGSPVFCDNRIVGILQMQAYNSGGALGVCLSSVKMFHDLLTEGNFKTNEYQILLKDVCIQHTKNQIEKNVKSKKYIADIFVEEGDYKENLRYFADPMLFLKKAIRDTKILDFESINIYLREYGKQEIDFSDLMENSSAAELEKVYVYLQDKISYVISCIEELEKNIDSDISDLGKYFEIRQNNFNSSIKFYLSDIKVNIDFIAKKYLLLTKDAGQGKTNFVCDFALNFLMRKGYCALYFNAYDFRENPMTLVQRKLSLDGTYLFTYVNKILEREWSHSKRPIVIIIDGLNENTVVKNFGQCIRDFLEECQTYPYIKVIMTTRNEFLQERFAVIEEGTYSGVYKHINMWHRGEDFKERIFWGYLNFFGITIRENTLTNKSYDTLTDDILLLRFFCEVNENKKQIYIYDVYKYDVFRQYLNRKSLEYQEDQQLLNHQDSLYALLDKISEYMIRENAFFNIPSSIFNETEQKLLYKMLDNEVIFKDEQIMKTGMLTRNTVVISFTFDEFRDFCITNYVLTHLAEQDAFLKFWNQMNEENLTIREGVQKYIFYLARTESQEDLLPIIQALPEYENLYWRYIWGLEDCHFTANDTKVWKEQLIANGPHAEKIVHDLIGKYDCEFFGNINISLLFEALDVLADRIDLYDALIKKMFGVYRQKKGIYRNPEPESLWPFNKMIQLIMNYVNDGSWNTHHHEWYRLVIYLFELENKGALDLWCKLYSTSPEVAVRILDEMNHHKNSLILCNVKEILHHLKRHCNGDAFDQIIERLIQENSFCRDISIDSELFSKLLFD